MGAGVGMQHMCIRIASASAQALAAASAASWDVYCGGMGRACVLVQQASCVLDAAASAVKQTTARAMLTRRAQQCQATHAVLSQPPAGRQGWQLGRRRPHTQIAGSGMTPVYSPHQRLAHRLLPCTDCLSVWCFRTPKSKLAVPAQQAQLLAVASAHSCSQESEASLRRHGRMPSSVCDDIKKGAWTPEEVRWRPAAARQRRREGFLHAPGPSSGPCGLRRGGGGPAVHRHRRAPQRSCPGAARPQDTLLRRLVMLNGPSKWSCVAEKIRGRSGKSCRLRWHNHLNPEVKKGTFSEWEDAVIIKVRRSPRPRRRERPARAGPRLAAAATLPGGRNRRPRSRGAFARQQAARRGRAGRSARC